MIEANPEITPPTAPSAPILNLCATPGCRSLVPAEIGSERYCVMHLTFNIEKVCSQLRCEISCGKVNPERQAEIAGYIAGLSVLLARITSSISLPDDRKKRVLSAFLTLMILRETLERAPLHARIRTRRGDAA